MSLTSRKSPILSNLSARRKHHIHITPTDQNAVSASDAEKRERPFAPIKLEGDANAAPKTYKSIFSL